jgi:hypothetical protein
MAQNSGKKFVVMIEKGVITIAALNALNKMTNNIAKL